VANNRNSRACSKTNGVLEQAQILELFAILRFMCFTKLRNHISHQAMLTAWQTRAFYQPFYAVTAAGPVKGFFYWGLYD
jgi:hypothetical protein